MLDAYDEEQYEDGNGKTQTRTVARFHPNIAPVKFAILPLIKKSEDQVKFAEELFAKLAKKYVCEYDDGGAIGKRYRRQDEIGTPYCLTIDHDTVDAESENYQTVTMRDRDTMAQKRVKIEEISL
jgi:glycyl-tRNA synthetase